MLLEANHIRHGQDSHCQDGRDEKMPKNSITQILIITDKQNLPIIICFLGEQYNKIS